MEKRGTKTSKRGKTFKDLSVKGKTGRKVRGGFEIKDYSFDVEQVTSIGSATTGAGAGKTK